VLAQPPSRADRPTTPTNNNFFIFKAPLSSPDV
jgi:hypothetical protein